MALIIGKQGSGSNIPKAPGTGTGLRCLGGETGEDLLRNAVARGITLYTVRNANPITGSFDIVATKDLKSYKTLAQYAEELGLSVAEREEIEQNVTALLEEKNGIFVPPGYGLHFVLCIALIDGLTVLHQKVAPYLLRARGNSLILHIPKKWDYIGVYVPWAEEAAAEIHGENLKLYGENDASVSLVPAFQAAGYGEYDLFAQNEEVYDGKIELGALLLAPSDLDKEGAFFANLFTRVSPPPFGTYRMDAWPEDVNKCRVPALQYESSDERVANYRVKALIPGGPVSFEQRNADPNSLADFFNTAPQQFENYFYDPIHGEKDYSLAQTPKPVSQGGLGPVRPGLYYKAGRLVAIITGEYYGHIKGPTFTESGDYQSNTEYTKISGKDGIITYATSNAEVPSGAMFPDEIGWADDLVRGQSATTSRLVRHFLHELSEPAATTDDGAVEFRIALTIKTGTTDRLVDHYRSTTVSIEGFSKENYENLQWRANLGTEENPVEVPLEQTTDENGRQELIVPLDQGALATETNADGLLFYSPLQVVTIIIYARFTSSSVVGSFRTAPDEELDFDTYVPYTIRDLGIRRGASNMLPRGGA